ncbi:MAG: hypothetical protein ACR2QS_16800 [Woeseiaceae bacterium]
MNHDIGKVVFGLVIGLLVAFLSYRWIMNAEPRLDRQLEEQVVTASRLLLQSTLNIGPLQIVDPLAPDRVVGKAYVYPRESDWEVSGFYRRDDNDLWHPYLMTLDANMSLLHLRISDTALLGRNGEGALEVLP